MPGAIELVIDLGWDIMPLSIVTKLMILNLMNTIWIFSPWWKYHLKVNVVFMLTITSDCTHILKDNETMIFGLIAKGLVF